MLFYGEMFDWMVVVFGVLYCSWIFVLLIILWLLLLWIGFVIFVDAGVVRFLIEGLVVLMVVIDCFGMELFEI